MSSWNNIQASAANSRSPHSKRRGLVLSRRSKEKSDGVLHAVDSKPGPLETKGSGTRKFNSYKNCLIRTMPEKTWSTQGGLRVFGCRTLHAICEGCGFRGPLNPAAQSGQSSPDALPRPTPLWGSTNYPRPHAECWRLVSATCTRRIFRCVD